MVNTVGGFDRHGGNLIVVLAAARVNGDRRQLDPALSGGHLQGVRWHLLQASWRGTPSALIGRIDEADWRSAPSLSAHGGVMLSVPSLGSTPAHLTLRTALGDALEVQAQAWLVELPDNGGLRPSLAC